MNSVRKAISIPLLACAAALAPLSAQADRGDDDHRHGRHHWKHKHHHGHRHDRVREYHHHYYDRSPRVVYREPYVVRERVVYERPVYRERSSGIVIDVDLPPIVIR